MTGGAGEGWSPRSGAGGTEPHAAADFSYGADAPTLYSTRQRAQAAAVPAGPTPAPPSVRPVEAAPAAGPSQPGLRPVPAAVGPETAPGRDRPREAAPTGAADEASQGVAAAKTTRPVSTSRLTPAGRAVLIAGVSLNAVGWGLGYIEAVALGLAALAAVVVALVWTHSVPSLEARREIAPARVARGEVAQGVVVLANRGSRTLRGLRAEDRVAGKAVHPVDLPPVPPGAEIRARYLLPTDQRGAVEVGPMVLVRSDPFGLARRVRECGSVVTLFVRPKTVPLPVLPAGRTHHLEGPTSDTADDGTLTFHSLREYVLGDDLRRVHWRSTARSGRLMVRRMIDVSLPTTTVVLDTSRDSYRDPEAFETAVDVAASVAGAAVLNHFPIRILTSAGLLPLAGGHEQGAEHILDRLTLVTPEHAHSLSSALDVLERLRDGDTLVVVSGGERPLPVERLVRLGRRFDRMLVVTAGGGHAAGAAMGLPRIAVEQVKDLDTAWRREAMR